MSVLDFETNFLLIGVKDLPRPVDFPPCRIPIKRGKAMANGVDCQLKCRDKAILYS